MNFGAVLRQAIASGQFRRVVEVSRELMDARRRDRALADLNARGGIRGGEGMRFRNAREGTSQRTLDSLIDRGFRPDMYEGFSAPGLRGNTTFIDPETGTRSIYSRLHRGLVPDDGSPIYTPYEGFRVLPEGGRYDAMYSEYSPVNNFGEELLTSSPGPWMGRGKGTNWAQLPWNGMDGSDGVYFGQFPGTRPLGGPLPWSDRPAFPWQMFADTGVPTPTRPGAYGTRTIPFEEVMRAQGSLMGDPRFGPYISY